ncbi:MAG TPA: DnaJ domain-containing protein, partial [bacterium]|nr:DnaJ domain-containing protein [bacterium]
MNGKNYYAVLGVDKGATPDQIKKAYRKLAKSCHPDTHPGDPAAEEKFKEVSEAYEILGDEKKRRQYDQMQAAFSQGFRPGGFDFSGSGVNFEDLFGGASERGGTGGYTYADLGGLGGLGDIFSQFMDLGGHIRQERAHVPERGHDISAQVTLPLDKALKGGKVRLTVKRNETCPSCGGSAAAAGTRPEVCPECGGRGRVVIPQGNIAVARPCPRCYGRGEIISKPCPECSGTGSVQATRKFSVKIPAGVRDRQIIRLPGQGDPGAA